MIPRVRLKCVVSGPALCPVQFSLRFSLGIIDTGPLRYASHSWIVGGRVSTASTRPWIALQQAFNPSACFAVSLLSPLASSQVESSLPSGDQGVARIRSMLSASHLSDSGILLMFADLVLIASPCSVTTLPPMTSSAYQQTLMGGAAAPTFLGLAGMYRIFSPNSRSGMLSLRPCSLCSGVFPFLPMSHLLIKYAANSTNQHNILASGGTLAPVRCSSAAFSVLAWPATRPTARSMISLDWLSPTGVLVRFPLPTLQSMARSHT